MSHSGKIIIVAALDCYRCKSSGSITRAIRGCCALQLPTSLMPEAPKMLLHVRTNVTNQLAPLELLECSLR